ncbi:MAG TPA: protein kinase, partial [Thermoanaerobaculia bacterium]|nr:protein kinase [Thermoanaerobaculia bacterium]
RLRTDRSVPDGLERLLREARTTARLNHPAIVQIHDLVEDETGLWIVMELAQGRTLRRLVEEEGPLPVAEAIRIGREIAEGLAEAHAHQVLHRDLKTSNVMISPSGRVKILDFGLAKRLPHGDESATQDAQISSAGILLGTCYAMSPEQALGQDLDARSDLFSLGTLLYEALSGESPFRTETPASSLARVLSHHPAPLHEVRAEVSRELSKLVGRLLEKDRLYRPQSAREVADALAALASPPVSLEIEGTTVIDSPLGTFRERYRTLGEHRLLTVVCCGLVGLDEPGEAGFLDPESLTEAMAGLHGLARDVCASFSGASEAPLGHRLWLYFGYPQIREDDAVRAVQAARELLARVGEIGPVFGPEGRREPTLRIAVHTGFSVVSIRSGRREQLQPGPLLETATALQDLARAGEVVVSGATRPLIARAFATKTLASARVRGLEEPVALYRVTGELDPRDESAPVAPLVGRESEIELLLDRYRLARAGAGQAILISGEPGIGKSRLIRALRERLAADPPTWQVTYGCFTAQSSPLAPFIQLLPGTATWLPARDRGRLMPAEAQRVKTFDAVIAFIAEMAERGPLVLVFEDIHWVDPSTIEILGLLLDEIRALPLLLIATFQPELQPPWPHRDHITHLSLGRLNEEDATALIDRSIQGQELPPNVRQQVLARAEGVPLYVEELTRTLLETGKAGESSGIPPTLGGSLAARLDRPGPAKEVAQIASVLGRTFTFDLLSSVASLDKELLQAGLSELIRAGLIHRRGLGERARYSFKHTLIQEAAYFSLLGKDRQRLHRKISEVLEAESTEPGILGHHLSCAIDPRNPDPALIHRTLPYLTRAGEQTLELGAYPEARAHLELALKLVRMLPEGSERTEQEQAVQALLERTEPA